jgi:hypothetical protein
VCKQVTVCPGHIWTTFYLPQHLLLEHPHPMFLPQRKTPSFTPIQNR